MSLLFFIYILFTCVNKVNVKMSQTADDSNYNIKGNNMPGYNGKYGVSHGGATQRPDNVTNRYAGRATTTIAKPTVNTGGSTISKGRYDKVAATKVVDKKDKMVVLRELALETMNEVTLTSTLNSLNLLVKTGKELNNCTVTYNEVYSLVGTPEECKRELELVITHINKIRIMVNPEFVGEISPFMDKVVSNVINTNFKNVRFKDVAKNINILLNLKDRDNIVWEKLVQDLTHVIDTMTDTTLQIKLKLVITDDESWIKHLDDIVVKEIEYDVPMYDNMFYILLNDKVFRAIGNRLNLIKA